MATRLLVGPLFDRVLVAPEQLEENTEDLFAMPGEAAKERPQQARVYAIGADVKVVKVGDVILHPLYAGAEVTVDGKTMLLLREAECMATLVVEEVPDEEVPELMLQQSFTPARKIDLYAEPRDEHAPDPEHDIREQIGGPTLCIDAGHLTAEVATHVASGPHGNVPFCRADAEKYERVMYDLGTPVELRPITYDGVRQVIGAPVSLILTPTE